MDSVLLYDECPHIQWSYVMMTLIILMNCILNDITTCNFLFQWLCLHFTVTNNSWQVWLCAKKSANTFIAVVHLTINFFSNYRHLVVVFPAALSPTITIHSLLLTHFTNNYYIQGWAFIKQMQLHISHQLSTITPFSFWP